MTERKIADFPEAQRAFVEQIAQYYYENDGMAHDRGRVIGWLIISDPQEQRASEIARLLGVSGADVDWVAEKLVPANVVTRRDAGDAGDYYLRMGDSAWVDRMQQVFSKIPEFHTILESGVGLLADADESRRERVVRMERFFGYLATEIPAIFDRYRESGRAQPA